VGETRPRGELSDYDSGEHSRVARVLAARVLDDALLITEFSLQVTGRGSG